jgi:hypothetical protein
MITDRDVAVRGIAKGKGPETKVREIMSEEVKYCFADQNIEEVAAITRNTKNARERIQIGNSAAKLSISCCRYKMGLSDGTYRAAGTAPHASPRTKRAVPLVSPIGMCFGSLRLGYKNPVGASNSAIGGHHFADLHGDLLQVSPFTEIGGGRQRSGNPRR